MNSTRLPFLAVALAVTGTLGFSAARADATMPTCGAGDSVVWENSSTKVYHAQGDSYFGKTKHGQYACKSDADKAGYHLAGSKSKGGTPGAASSAASASPMEDASPAASPTAGKHHHHKKKGGAPSPAPSAT